MPWTTNLPPEPLKWTLARAAAEFQISIPTLTTKLNQANQVSAADRSFTTKQLVEGLFGSVYQERIAKCRAEREKTELEVSILRGDFLSRIELQNAFSQIATAILEIVKSSSLTKEEQADVCRAISSIPVVIKAAAKVQARGQNGQSANGAEKRKRGRPRKEKPAVSET